MENREVCNFVLLPQIYHITYLFAEAVSRPGTLLAAQRILAIFHLPTYDCDVLQILWLGSPSESTLVRCYSMVLIQVRNYLYVLTIYLYLKLYKYLSQSF